MIKSYCIFALLSLVLLATSSFGEAAKVQRGNMIGAKFIQKRNLMKMSLAEV